MRICFISPYSSEGGAEFSLIELIDALSPLGVECSCIVREEGPMVDVLAARRVETTIVPFKPWVHAPRSSLRRLLKMSPYRQIAGSVRVAQAIKRSGCDLVYTNSIATGAGAIGSWIAGKPHVWHLREFGYDDYRLSYDLGLRFSRFLMKKLTSAFIANSMSVADAYGKELNGATLKVVYNAVAMPNSIEDTSTRDLWRHPNALRCILLGKYMPGKGQQDAISAMLRLRQENVPVQLVLAGETLDKNYHRQIENLIKHHDLTDRVCMLGHSSNPASLMKSADVVLVCSRREAFGRVTVEGMKLGKPVIGTRSGGSTEIIEEGQTGLLYQPGDWQDLARKIAYLQQSASLRERMGSAARASAHARFNQGNYGAGIANVICDVLHQEEPRPRVLYSRVPWNHASQVGGRGQVPHVEQSVDRLPASKIAG